MNIVAILASGVGNRFDSNVPKQFHKICGKMVIEYVLDAVLSSVKVDKIVIATNTQLNSRYIKELLSEYNFDVINGGETRNLTLKNVIDYISDTYNCKKLIVCDAVRPMLSGGLIDSYFEFLDDYSAVVTAQKITDSLGCVNFSRIDREQFYLMQSPEGFNFDLLRTSFNPFSNLTEVTQQLPEGCPIKLFFDFRNNIKLTYPEDLKYLEILIREKFMNPDFTEIIDNVVRLKKYLYKEHSSSVNDWILLSQKRLPALFDKWKIESYKVLKTSHFGIVMFANSLKYGDCVIKIIPPFINRYKQEKLCYNSLSSQYMCELYDYDDHSGALLLEKCDNCNEAVFGTNSKKIYNFFETIQKLKVESYEIEIGNFHNYSELLHQKCYCDNFEYKKAEIMEYVKKATNLFDEVFSQESVVLIHGDLHRHNIVEKNHNLVAIDPIGYIAPFEIELARYIGTELTDTDGNPKELLQNIVELFEPLTAKNKLLAACFIDISFRLHNSIFENTDYLLTDKWLKILREAF